MRIFVPKSIKKGKGPKLPPRATLEKFIQSRGFQRSAFSLKSDKELYQMAMRFGFHGSVPETRTFDRPAASQRLS